MKFRYEALDAAGSSVSGELEAADGTEAYAQLQLRQLTPVTLTAAAAVPASARGRPRATDLALLIRELATLLGGGVALAEAVSGLAEAHRGDALAAPLMRILSALRSGTAFSSALRDAGLALPPYVAQLAEAGELTGTLGAALLRAADQMDYELAVAGEFRTALIYPSVLVTAGVASVLLIFTFVVPRFAAIVRNPRADVPAISRWVIESGLFFREHQALIGLGLLAVAAAVWSSLRGAATRRAAVELAARLPLIGQWLRETATARWASMLSALLESRVPIVRALELAREAVPLASMQSALQLAAADVRAGKRLSEALQLHSVLAPLGINLVRVGERSGELPRMLATLAQMHQQAGRTRMKRFLTILEPAAIVLIGGVIGIIMVAVILGITSLSNIRF